MAQRLADQPPPSSGFCSSSAPSGPRYRPPSSEQPMRIEVPARVQIVDDIPIFRNGLSEALRERGLDVVAVGPSPAPVGNPNVVIYCITRDEAWEALHEMCDHQQVIAVVQDPVEENELRALTEGAAGAAARSSDVSHVVEAITAVTRGYMLIDLDLVQHLCGHLARRAPYELSLQERRWLTRLSNGVTISVLARDAGYSERAMYRVMRGIYDRMKVDNLYQALIEATRYRLLD